MILFTHNDRKYWQKTHRCRQVWTDPQAIWLYFKALHWKATFLLRHFFKQIITMRNNDFFVGQQSFTAILQQILGWPYKTD